ncbi:voltage-dependent T-type calcium channel subunit alpha-1H-like isoform X3 [Vanacampus margaritifer]
MDGRCSPVVPDMTDPPEPDPHHGGPSPERGERDQEGGDRVHVAVEGEGQRRSEEEEGEEDEEEAKEEEEELPYPSLAPVVLLVLSQTSPPRSWCLRVVCHPWFERVSILAILLNCVTLGMFQPCDDTHFLLQALDDGIFVFFAGEMLVKMVALGIVGHNGYLGDTWNRLDFFIVIVGMLEYSLDGHNLSLSAIRTVRVLRPLRAINRVPSMRILVTLLLDTLPMLGNVLALCFFVFFIFGIVGVQLWAGLLRNRCFMGEDVKTRYNISFLSVYYRPGGTEDHPFICSAERDNGMLRCADVPRRRVAGTACYLPAEDARPERAAVTGGGHGASCVNWYQYYNECRAGELNPHKGAINFDNIGYAWIAIFQVITLEGWVDIMYYVMDAHSFYNFIYFIFLIIVGSFFMINLCLVVIATQFSETKQREHALMKSEQRARQLHQSASTLASDSQPGSCYEEIIRYLAHLGRKACRRLTRLMARGAAGLRCACAIRRRRDRGVAEMNGLAHRHSGHVAGDLSHLHQMYHQRHPPPPVAERRLSNGGFNYPVISPLLTHSDAKSPYRKRAVAMETVNRLPQLEHGGCAAHPALPLPGVVPVESSACPYCSYYNQLCDPQNEAADEHHHHQRGPVGSPPPPPPPQPPCKSPGPRLAQGPAGRPLWRACARCWAELRAKLELIVASRYFNRGIMIAILINTLSMGIEYHEQPQELTDILEISNMVFTSLFSLEMLLKVLALGLFGYIKNPYNGFDSTIVIISVWEIVGEAEGGLSVLRTFRLLRVLKLVRFLPALRRQLVVLMKTMDNVATFCMLLMLFIFIFSILGMHLFGCKFGLQQDSGDTLPDRKNFDSLLWATVTVFQILTQEDWNAVLYNGMASTTPLAALYFVALMTFGNYVLFNLLVAILVEGFQAEGDASRSDSDDEGQSLSYDDEEKLRELYAAELKIRAMIASPNGLLNPRASMPPPLSLPVITHTAATPTVIYGQSRRTSAASVVDSFEQQRSPPPWDSRRSSWTSLGRAPSLGRRSQSGEMESLLSDGHSASDAGSREASVDTPDYLQVPVLHTPDCNGTAAFHLPEHAYDDTFQTSLYNTHAEDEDVEETLYQKLRKLLEPYEPQWCVEHEDWSLYVFAPHNRFRLWCQKTIGHKMFDYIILLFIFLNCITIALERPDIQPHSMERVFLSVSNYIFTVIFVGEMMIKVVAMGMYFGGKGVYLQSSWNILDGVLVLVSMVDILVSVASAGGNRILGILRVLRLLRTLRPLRVISRAPGLKLVVETLITSLRPIGNIVLICCAFFIVFGILGVQLFKGKFFHCEGYNVTSIANKTQCLDAGHRWLRRKYNFDNLGQALMSLFVLSCKDGWVSIMYDGLDAVGVDQQLLRAQHVRGRGGGELPQVSAAAGGGGGAAARGEATQASGEEAAEGPGEAVLRRLLAASSFHPQRVHQPLHGPLHHHHHLHQPAYHEHGALQPATVPGGDPQVLQLHLHGGVRHRGHPQAHRVWSPSLFQRKMEPVGPGHRAAVHHGNHAGRNRPERLAAHQPHHHTHHEGVEDHASSETVEDGHRNASSAGHGHASAASECSEENPCEGLSRHATFDNFGMAFLTLFRVSTGDNWNGIMKDTLRDCRPEDRHCFTYLPLISPVYFVTFVLTAQFVLVNVVVAVLMKHLEESNKEAQLEEMEERREREEAARRNSAASGGGDNAAPNGDAPAQVQVEDEERCRGNLLSIGRMLSLPSDSFGQQPLRCAPYPPGGVDAYSAYSYLGSMSSLGSSGGGSLLQVPGALPAISHASLGYGRSSRPMIHLSSSQSIDRGSPRQGGPADRRRRLDSAHSVDGGRFSPARVADLRRLSSAHSVDGCRAERAALVSSCSIDRQPSLRLSSQHGASTRPSHWLSPEESLDRNKLSPSYVPESSVLKRPASFRAAGRQLRRQEAVRCDSLDQSGSADNVSDSHPPVPAGSPSSPTPPRQRSSSVHTLKYTQPQRVISCRSRGDTAGSEPGPESDQAGKDAVGAAPQAADDPDEEVLRINTHSHRHLAPDPDEARGRLSQSVSPVSGRNRKERVSPPPGEEPVTMATQLMDSSVELRRRTLSFDATAVATNQPETGSLDD